MTRGVPISGDITADAMRRLQAAIDAMLRDFGEARYEPVRPPREPYESPEDKARKILLQNLTEVQRQQLAKWKAFGVIGSRGGRYIIWESYFQAHVAGTYRWFLLFHQTNTFCSLSKVPIPVSDRMLSWKLWIEANESGFHKRANVLHYQAVPTDALTKLTNQMLQSRKSKPA